VIDLRPPEAVRRACADGLALYHKGYGGKGLKIDTIIWAERMERGEPVSEEKIRKMGPWFARHEVDIKPDSKRQKTPGWVAWQLWAGYAGRRWAASMIKALARAR
jgi:hypothetical protein